MTFSRSRGFSAALRGERLRPADVDACPELPYAKSLAQRLTASQFATLSGGSGTGKSVTAFHAARHLNKAGWAVVELARAGVAGIEEVTAFASMPGPVLAVVDDAQALEPAVVADFEAVVDAGHAVLLVSTERLEDHNDERVAEVRAKEVVYEYCVANVDDIGPMLIALDDRVGYGMMRELPLRRLRAAYASSRDPWSFMFVASGGERRMAGIVDRLAENPSQVLVLAAIAVGQIVSQDAGVSRDQVALAVAQVTPDAFGPPDGPLNEYHFNAAFEAVQAERIVRDNNGQLRTAHIRVADRAVLDLARHADEAIGPSSRALVRNHLLRPDIPILGKYWLVESLGRSDSLRYRWREEWLGDDVVDALVDDCLSADPGRDRSLAGHLVASLSFAHVLDRSNWEPVAERVAAWLSTLTSDEVFGMSRLLMHLRGAEPDLHRQVSRSLLAGDLASIFCTRGTRASAQAWSELLRELAPAYDSDDREAWIAEFAEGMDHDALQNWLAVSDADSHPSEIYDLIDTLAELAPTAATAALYACSEHLRVSFETGLGSAVVGITRWTFGHMNLVAHLASAVGAQEYDKDDPDEHDAGSGERGVPSEALIELAAATLQVMQQVDWAKAAASLTGRSPYEIESLDVFLAWLGWLSTDLLDELAVAVSFDWLIDLAVTSYEDVLPPKTRDGSTSNRTRAPATHIDAISTILEYLAQGERGRERVRAYMEASLGTLKQWPFRLISAFPDLAVAALRAGSRVRLENPRGGTWTENRRALQALQQVDPAAAAEVLAASHSQLRPALESPQSHDMRDLPAFIEIADAVDPSALDSVLAVLDVDGCKSTWPQRLNDAGEQARALVERVSRTDSPLAEMAREILG